MQPAHTSRRLFCLLILTRAFAAISEAPADDNQRTDAYGDPLPSGAVCRLGTLRLRHHGRAYSVAYSPDGGMLAACSDNGVYIWDAHSGRRLRIIRAADHAQKELTGIIGAIAFSTRPPAIAFVQPGTLHLYDADTGAALNTVPLKNLDFNSNDVALAIDSGGGSLAVAAGEECALFEFATGNELARVGRHGTEISGLDFSSDGKLLALSALEPAVEVWNVQNGTLVCRPEKEEFARAVSFSPDDRLLAAAIERNVKVFDVETGKPLLTLVGTNERDLLLDAEITPDGKHVVAGSQNGQIFVWELNGGKRLHVLGGWMWSLCDIVLSPDGTRIAASFSHNAIRVWRTETGKVAHRDLLGHETEVYDVAFAPDGSTVATGGGDSQVYRWDPTSGRRRPEFHSEASGSTIAYSPDGKLFASAWQYDPTVRISDGSTGEPLHDVTASSQVKGFAFTRDGRRLVAIGQDFKSHQTSLNVWDVASGELLVEAQRETESYVRANCAAVSPDGRTVAIACGSSILFWDLATGAESRAWNAHGDHSVNSLVFSPDGLWLVSGSHDQTVRIWDAATGRNARVLRGHQRSVKALAVSPDGLTIASGGEAVEYRLYPDETQRIRFWDLLSGEQIAELSGHETNTISLAYSPDGRQLVSGHQDTTALVWNVPPAARLDAGDPRELNPEEFETQWQALKSGAALEARRAIQTLIAGRESSVRFLNQRLKPVPAPDAEFVNRHIRQMDSNDYKVRTDSFAELKPIAFRIQKPLEAALAGGGSAELRSRCELLLEEARRPTIAEPDTLRDVRAIHVLRLIGSPEARAIARELSRGVPGVPQTETARSFAENSP